MIISFSGLDGSGKSSLLREFSKKQVDNFKIKDEFDFFFIKLVKKILPKKHFTDYKENKIVNKKEHKPKKWFQLIVGIFYPIIILLEYFWDYFYYEIIFRKKILIKDRYIYDFIISLKKIGVTNGFYEFLFLKFPQPSFLFFINVSQDVLKKRLKNRKSFIFSDDHYNFLYREYENVFSKVKSIKINNDCDFNKSLNNVLKIYNFKKSVSKKTIAISGIDGAGKTTLVENLTKELKNLNIKYKYIHFYYNYSILKFIKIFYRKRKTQEEVYKSSIEHEKKAKNSKKNSFWKYIVLTDAFLQYLFVKTFYFNRVIIFDRFFYDYLVSFDFLGVDYNKSFMTKIFPKTDYKFLLLAEPKILFDRKPEHSLEFFEECVLKYQVLSKDFSLTLLDSGKNDQDEILELLLEKIK